MFAQRPLITALKNKRQMQLHGVSTPHTGQAEALKQLPMPGTAIYDQTANALLIRCASDTVIAVSEVCARNRTLQSMAVDALRYIGETTRPHSAES